MSYDFNGSEKYLQNAYPVGRVPLRFLQVTVPALDKKKVLLSVSRICSDPHNFAGSGSASYALQSRIRTERDFKKSFLQIYTVLTLKWFNSLLITGNM
jgi:hypothetical protein